MCLRIVSKTVTPNKVQHKHNLYHKFTVLTRSNQNLHIETEECPEKRKLNQIVTNLESKSQTLRE